jgi:peptide/nickel transport system permease protein
VLGLDFAALLGNAFLVELVFTWPGIARYGAQAMLRKDLNAITAVVLIIGLTFVVVNIGVDLITSYINPRIRLAEAQ